MLLIVHNVIKISRVIKRLKFGNLIIIIIILNLNAIVNNCFKRGLWKNSKYLIPNNKTAFFAIFHFEKLMLSIEKKNIKSICIVLKSKTTTNGPQEPFSQN